MRAETPLFHFPVTHALEVTRDRVRWSAPSIATPAGGSTPDERLRLAAQRAMDLLDQARPFVVEGGPEAAARESRTVLDGSLGDRRPGLLSILRGEQETRIVRAADLAREWATPLSLCGICGYLHLWDRLLGPAGAGVRRGRTPGPAGPAGQWWTRAPAGEEPLAWWARLAEVVNAIRLTTLRGREGRPADAETLLGDLTFAQVARRMTPAELLRLPAVAPDDALLWGPAESPPTGGDEDDLARWRSRWANVREIRTDPAVRRQQVVGVVNVWSRATCVSPGLGLPPDLPLAESPEPVVSIGSPLAWIGWALREELIYTGPDGQGADVRECERCGVTWRSQRRRVDTGTPGKEPRKRKSLCPWCDEPARKRESRAKEAADDRSTG